MPRLSRTGPSGLQRQLLRLQRESVFVAPILRLALAFAPQRTWSHLATTRLASLPARGSQPWHRERVHLAEASAMLQRLAVLEARATDPRDPAPTRSQLLATFDLLASECSDPCTCRRSLAEDCGALARLADAWLTSDDGAAGIGGLLRDIAWTCCQTWELDSRVAALVALAMLQDGFGVWRVEANPAQKLAALAATNLLLGNPPGHDAEPDSAPLRWSPADVADLYTEAAAAWLAWLRLGAVPAALHRWLGGAVDCHLIDATWPLLPNPGEEEEPS